MVARQRCAKRARPEKQTRWEEDEVAHDCGDWTRRTPPNERVTGTVAVRRQEQLGIGSSEEHKTFPQGLADGDLRERRPDAELDVLHAEGGTSTGRSTTGSTNKNRLHQTC